MEKPVSGGQSRRPGVGGRSPGAGLLPRGAVEDWIRLERPANDNQAPWALRIGRWLRIAALVGVAALIVYSVTLF